MNTLQLSARHTQDATLVSNVFIEQYMPDANGEFVKLYLYLLRCFGIRQNAISVASLADSLNETEADVLRALKYWHKLAVLQLITADGRDAASLTDGSALQEIVLCDLTAGTTDGPAPGSPRTTTGSAEKPSSGATAAAADSAAGTASATSQDYTAVSNRNTVTPISIEAHLSRKAKPVYTPAQMEEIASQEEFALLKCIVEHYTGKPLSQSECATIMYLYDSLHFSVDLIDYLICYCFDRDKKSMRYIEKVALAWADAGITTVRQAKKETEKHSDAVYSVMKAFGMSGRMPGEAEQAFIKKWSDQYCFESDIILEACNRTIRSIHQPSFEYADSILTRWYKDHVRTSADIEKADAAFEAARVSSAKNRKPASAGSSNAANGSGNRFNNFAQSGTDLDSLENSLISNN